MVALCTRGLRQLVVDEDLAVLRLQADRRDELSRARTQVLNRLHRLLVHSGRIGLVQAESSPWPVPVAREAQ
jgi:hypothetical protein